MRSFFWGGEVQGFAVAKAVGTAAAWKGDRPCAQDRPTVERNGQTIEEATENMLANILTLDSWLQVWGGDWTRRPPRLTFSLGSLAGTRCPICGGRMGLSFLCSPIRGG